MIIPSVINQLCLLYIDDHFLKNQGTFLWGFTQFELNKLLKCVNTRSYPIIKSNTFSMCKIPWKITIYPNGQTSTDIGKVVISLELLKWPTEWTGLSTKWTFKMMEAGKIITVYKTQQKSVVGCDMQLTGNFHLFKSQHY